MAWQLVLMPKDSKKKRRRNGLSAAALLEQIGGQFGQVASLSLHQIDVGKDVLSPHFVGKVGQAVRLHIQIGRVDLVHVPRKHYFGAFSGTGNDGLYFMGCEVLRLVNNKKGVGQAAAADVGQGCNKQFVPLLHVLNQVQFLALGSKTVFNDRKVVVQGQHVGPDFLLGVTR